MIEIILLNYLNNVLSVPAYMEKPVDAPARYVVLEKTGSALMNHIDTATFAIQSYGPSMYDAAALNEEVKAATLAAVTLDDISNVTLNSDYNYTDTATKVYRYQAVFDITHY